MQAPKRERERYIVEVLVMDKFCRSGNCPDSYESRKEAERAIKHKGIPYMTYRVIGEWIRRGRTDRRVRHRVSYQSGWRKKNRKSVMSTTLKWQAENPEKVLAAKMVRRAVKNGSIVKAKKCHDCGKGGRLHGHHEDYSKPLEVVWLCGGCHVHRHR